MRATSILVIALAMAVTLPLAARQQAAGPRRQLQAAINKETVEGDLKTAIEMYRKVADAATDRAVAAKALLRMGACYEKLGGAESQKAYERVVAEFQDQKDAVVEAHKRLAANAAGARPETGVIERHLWSHSPNAEPTGISADGRFISLVDLVSSRVTLHDLVTGEDRTVAANTLCWPAVLSADARQIACTLIKNDRDMPELRVLRTDGAAARTVRSGTEVPIPADWSPDGKFILARMARKGPTPDKSYDMVLVSVADGSTRVLKSGGGVEDRFTTPRFSPDGRYIVHPAARSGADGKAIVNLRGQKGTLHLMAVNGGSEVALVQGAPAEQDWNPVWTPDGRRIVFLSNRSGVTALWAVEVRDGRPQGNPEFLSAAAGEPIGFARDGTLFIERSTLQSDVWVAECRAGDRQGPLASRPASTRPSWAARRAPSPGRRTDDRWRTTGAWTRSVRWSCAQWRQGKNAISAKLLRSWQVGSRTDSRCWRGGTASTSRRAVPSPSRVSSEWGRTSRERMSRSRTTGSPSTTRSTTTIPPRTTGCSRSTSCGDASRPGRTQDLYQAKSPLQNDSLDRRLAR